MRTAVKNTFVAFTVKFEGKLPCLYLDVKGFVTTGIGDLVDPIQAALSLPWKRPDGTPASQNEIAAEWGYVKSRTDLAKKGGGAFLAVTKLRLDDAGIAALVLSKLQANEALLKTYYPSYETWPADAQLGLHSMAWAMGPAFHFPLFRAAVNKTKPDFAAAAVQCFINDPGNPIGGRNAANKLLFNNADVAQRWGLDYEQLWYPNDASKVPNDEPDVNVTTSDPVS